MDLGCTEPARCSPLCIPSARDTPNRKMNIPAGANVVYHLLILRTGINSCQ
jgi:hypothetical protein